MEITLSAEIESHRKLAPVFFGQMISWQGYNVELVGVYGQYFVESGMLCVKQITIDLDEITLDPWLCVAHKIPVNICFEKWVGEHLAYTEYFDFRKVQEVNSFIRCLQHEDLGRINYTQIDPEYLKQIEAV